MSVALSSARISLPAESRPWVQIEAAPGAALDALATDELIALYKTHGALLLRGFPPGLDAFRAFTARFCSSSVFNESPDRLLLDDAHNIQSVNGGGDPFPLHPELSREPWKPDVCFFHCLQPPGEGGETTICDGVELVRRLDPEMRNHFARSRLLYALRAMPEQLQFWLGADRPTREQLAYPPASCPYRFAVGPDGVWRYFTRPALHKPMFADDPAFGNFLLFARDYNGRRDYPVLEDGRPVPDDWMDAVRAAAAPITIPVSWQAGDLLMIDNTRFMHGRNAISDPGERLIASYFGYLSFAEPDPEEPPNALWRQAGFRPPRRAR